MNTAKWIVVVGGTIVAVALAGVAALIGIDGFADGVANTLHVLIGRWSA